MMNKQKTAWLQSSQLFGSNGSIWCRLSPFTLWAYISGPPTTCHFCLLTNSNGNLEVIAERFIHFALKSKMADMNVFELSWVITLITVPMGRASIHPLFCISCLWKLWVALCKNNFFSVAFFFKNWQSHDWNFWENLLSHQSFDCTEIVYYLHGRYL